MFVIFFAGKNHVGKTIMSKHIAKTLERNLGFKTEQMSFADPVRDELIELYGLPAEIIFDKTINKNTTMVTLGNYQYDREIPKLWRKFGFVDSFDEYRNTTISLREVFITHATRIRRAQDPDYWVKEFTSLANRLPHDTDFLIIDDARYHNEFMFGDHKHIVWLENGSQYESDITQDAALKWYNDNKDLVTTADVKIPLLNCECDRVLVRHIAPHIPVIKQRFFAAGRKQRQ